jgi:hypothetical protein
LDIEANRKVLGVLRAAVSNFHSPGAALENAVPLVFALILSILISGLLGVWSNGEGLPFQTSSWAESSLSVGMGVGILLLQIVIP